MAFEPNPGWKTGDEYPADRMVKLETVVAANEAAVAAVSPAPTADTLSGATTVGKSVLKATDAAAARAAIGAGTSSLALGDTATTAAKGDHTHAYADLTGKPTIPSATPAGTRAQLDAGTDTVVRAFSAKDIAEFVAAQITAATTPDGE
ncbi:hypothetical protein [Corynebacterium nuruki]|uniref:hypothetical protein n=1 Tax=Corynebacterium nuruki TaxID=1032851 RepID=UPI0039BF824B